MCDAGLVKSVDNSREFNGGEIRHTRGILVKKMYFGRLLKRRFGQFDTCWERKVYRFYEFWGKGEVNHNHGGWRSSVQ